MTADKYDLAGPVRAHAKSMLQDWLTKRASWGSESAQSLMSIIIGAYVLDQESAFRSATKGFIRYGVGLMSDCYTQCVRNNGIDMAMIPARLPGKQV